MAARWSRWVRGALAGVLILGAGAGVYAATRPGRAASAACAAPVPLKIVSSTEKSDVLAGIAGRYNGTAGRCGQVSVVEVSSGIAEEILAGDPHKDSAITGADRTKMAGAHVWAPSAALWLDRLDLDTKNGVDYDRNHLSSLASSPLVLAMPEALRSALGWDKQPPTWRQAMDALRTKRLHYTQENPRTSTSGALATYLTYAAAAADATGRLALQQVTGPDLPRLNTFVREVQAAANGGFRNDSVDILRSWSEPDGVPANTMIMVQEQMVSGFNAGLYARFDDRKPAVRLVSVYPVEPGPGAPQSIVAEHPYVKLPELTDEQSRAADDFLAYVRREWGPLCDAGFRPPLDGRKFNCVKREAGKFAPVGLPDSATQAAMVDTWNRLRPLRRITIAMDVSGSMKDDRLRSAAAAVNEGVSRLRPTDQVEIYRFAGSEQFTGAYWPVRPLAERGEHPETEAAFQRLGDMSRDRHSTAMSGVYQTVDELYRQVAARQRADGANALNVLIVLSDGIEDWKDNGRKPRDVCAGWKKAGQVPVHTIHYPPGMYEPKDVERGVDALRIFATCSGLPGSALASTDSEPMRKIFSQVLGSV